MRRILLAAFFAVVAANLLWAQAPVKVQVQALVAVQSPARIRALAAQIESWNNLDWRTKQIHKARANEAAERWMELARQDAQAPIAQVESAD